MALLCGRAGRLTAQNGGFRRGQITKQAHFVAPPRAAVGYMMPQDPVHKYEVGTQSVNQRFFTHRCDAFEVCGTFPCKLPKTGADISHCTSVGRPLACQLR
jgi:hypothetical protein